MEWLIIIAVGLICGVGAGQINKAIDQQEAKKRDEFVIRDVKIKPCPKINGIDQCKNQNI